MTGSHPTRVLRTAGVAPLLAVALLCCAGRADAGCGDYVRFLGPDGRVQLDGDWSEFTPAERALFTVARKLAASPIVLTDAEVAEALKLTSPRDVVQLVNYVTVCASFDRITEAAGLRLEK